MMPEFYMDSPSLVNVGGRLNKNWMAKWIANPKKFNQHSHMPSLVNKEEAQHIAEFLSGDSSVDLSGNIKGDSQLGAELFYDLGCISCHTRPEEKVIQGDRLLLSNVSKKFKPQALKQYLISPEKLYKWTKMPNFKLSEKEASDLSAFLIEKSATSQEPTFKADKNLGEKIFMTCIGHYLVNFLGHTNRPNVHLLSLDDNTTHKNHKFVVFFLNFQMI